MWARLRLDISPADLAFGFRQGLSSGNRQALVQDIERFWGVPEQTIVSYSVRTGFDLLLQALDLPPKSEILFSALNINGMIRIVQQQGFVPVPVDLDREHMAPNLEIMEKAITPQTRAIVVAHLFGSRVDLGPVCELAKKHNLFVVEDCAQAFDGPSFSGHLEADATLFSFGPLKTSTALGGALLRIKDVGLATRMREIQAKYPMQSAKAYLKRVVKFGALTLLSQPIFFRWVAKFFLWKQLDTDDATGDQVRAVTALGSSERKIRRQPATAMFAMLKRRLQNWTDHHLDGRVRSGKALLSLLDGKIECPGIGNPRHTFWVFPVMTDTPKDLITALRKEGFDGAPFSPFATVPPPEDRPELDPVVARTALANTVILPCHEGLPPTALAQEAQIVLRQLGKD